MKRKLSSKSSGRLRRKYKRRRFGKSNGKSRGRVSTRKYKGLRRKVKSRVITKNSKYAMRIAKRVFPQVISKWMTMTNSNRTLLEQQSLELYRRFHKTAHMVNHPHQDLFNNGNPNYSVQFYPQSVRSLCVNNANIIEPIKGTHTVRSDIHEPTTDFTLPRGFNRLMKMYESGIATRGTCRWKIRLLSQEVERGFNVGVLETFTGAVNIVAEPPIVHIACAIVTPEEYAQFFPFSTNSNSKVFEDKLKMGPISVLEVPVPYGKDVVLDLTRKYNISKAYGKLAVQQFMSSALKSDGLSTLPVTIGADTYGGNIYPIDEFGFRSYTGEEQSLSDHTNLRPPVFFRPLIGVCFIWQKFGSNLATAVSVNVEYSNTSKYTFVNRRVLDPVQADIQAVTAPVQFPSNAIVESQLLNLSNDQHVIGGVNALNGVGNI